MNSMCKAIQRPEESIQTTIEKCFLSIFSQIGPFVGLEHVEKAEELLQNAFQNLELSGAANRAGCAVIAGLAKYVPSILHKTFYKLASKVLIFLLHLILIGIIFEQNDIEHKMRLVGALNTFRQIFDLVVNNLTEFSLNSLQKV